MKFACQGSSIQSGEHPSKAPRDGWAWPEGQDRLYTGGGGQPSRLAECASSMVSSSIRSDNGPPVMQHESTAMRPGM